ncbi:MAG: hypothetical protein ACKVHE_29460, partial [Planctomycetales bacterium]
RYVFRPTGATFSNRRLHPLWTSERGIASRDVKTCMLPLRALHGNMPHPIPFPSHERDTVVVRLTLW